MYEELSLNGFIKEIREVTSGPHPRKFCFVLGAGASITSGIKSAQELVNLWEKELLERNREKHLRWKQELNINDTNKYSFYNQYYEERFKRRPIDGYNYLEKLMERAKPSIGHVMLSYLLTQTQNNVVITTNFDHMIEEAITYYTRTLPLVIEHETLAHYVSAQPNKPMVIKIHRELLFHPNRAEPFGTLHENWKEALNKVFSEYHPIFIGYAGNDKSLINFLLENVDKFLNNEWKFPYWMFYDTEEVSDTILKFLDDTNGYLIKHTGFDEVLYLLAAELECKLPSKTMFVSDAEKRFQMLTNTVDDFTEKTATAKAVMWNDYQEIEKAIQKVTSQTKLQSLYRKAIMLSHAARYLEASEIMSKLVKLDPENARYHSGVATTLHELERYEEALKEAQLAVELEPDNAKYHDILSRMLYETKNYEEALKEAQKAVKLDPENARYHDNFRAALYQMELYEEAIKEGQRAVELDPNNAKYHNNLGNMLQEMKYFDEATKEKQIAAELESGARATATKQPTVPVRPTMPEPPVVPVMPIQPEPPVVPVMPIPPVAPTHDISEFVPSEMKEEVKQEQQELSEEDELKEAQKAVEAEPNNASYHDNLGMILYRMERFDEALSEKQKAAELEPDNASYHDSLGVVLYKMKRFDDAIKEAQKAVDLEPDNANYHDNLGVMFYKMKRFNEAIKERQKAAELEPDNASYHDNLGLMLFKVKRYDEAIKEKQKAVELDPDNAKYHDNLGVMLFKLKRYDEAVKEKQKAAELDAENAGYHSSLAIMLQKLKRYDEAAKEAQKAVDLEPDNASYHESLESILKDKK